MGRIYVVRVQSRRANGDVYYIALPKEYAIRLGVAKGSLLKCELKTIAGKEVVVYSKVE